MKEKLLYSLGILSILSLMLSCGSSAKDENEETLKKLSSIFIEENGVEMIKWMMGDSINVMNIAIKKEEYLTLREILPPPPPPPVVEPVKFFFPTLDLYLFYSNMGCSECDYCSFPSSIYYVDGYPVLLYDEKKPSLAKKDIPQYLFRYEKEYTKEVDWLVAICRKNQEYVIIRDYWATGDEILDELKEFEKRCSANN